MNQYLKCDSFLFLGLDLHSHSLHLYHMILLSDGRIWNPSFNSTSIQESWRKGLHI
jgi:hypothetical protein